MKYGGKQTDMLRYVKNILISLLILAASFGVCLLIQNVFLTESLIPAVFVLAVFLISFLTEGYIYGVVSALFSVLIFNFAFSLPFFEFNFTIPENIISAVIMIIVTIITGTLTAQIKRQEAIKAESEKERMRANLLRAVSQCWITSMSFPKNRSLQCSEVSERTLSG